MEEGEAVTTGASLRGENKGGRAAGVGSSPTPLTKSEKTRLWKRLRNYDRKISALDREIQLAKWRNAYVERNAWPLERLKERRARWDEKRKRVRALLKGHREVKP